MSPLRKHNVDDDEVKKIVEHIQNYHKKFRDVADSPIGRYTINNILELVEEALNYLEIFAPIINKWAEDYLSRNRDILWLSAGLKQGSYLTDYWKIGETKLDELQRVWPFLFDRKDRLYKGYIIDLNEAQEEVCRQKERESRSNPKYEPFHPDGCPSNNCSCWMLDDMEQWHQEEQEEINSSKNIFFNGRLQQDFFNTIDLEALKEQWENWKPARGPPKTYSTELDLFPGITPIHIIRSWIREDFYYSIFSMFDWYDHFSEVWNQIDSADNFIYCQRQKLKKIVELL